MEVPSLNEKGRDNRDEWRYRKCWRIYKAFLDWAPPSVWLGMVLRKKASIVNWDLGLALGVFRSVPLIFPHGLRTTILCCTPRREKIPLVGPRLQEKGKLHSSRYREYTCTFSMTKVIHKKIQISKTKSYHHPMIQITIDIFWLICF